MTQTDRPELILASASPRRQELMGELNLPFSVYPSRIPETVAEGESSRSFAVRMAREKANAVANQFPGEWVLGADTIVVIPGAPETILGKPSTEREAFRMLRSLSGREHRVVTGVALVRNLEERKTDSHSWFEESRIFFRVLRESEIREYIKTGEPMDKAGAYAIQGGAKRFVDHYEGSWSNIVGLPMESLRLRLNELGLLGRGGGSGMEGACRGLDLGR